MTDRVDRPKHNDVSRLIRVAAMALGLGPCRHEHAIYAAAATFVNGAGPWSDVEFYAVETARRIASEAITTRERDYLASMRMTLAPCPAAFRQEYLGEFVEGPLDGENAP